MQENKDRLSVGAKQLTNKERDSQTYRKLDKYNIRIYIKIREDDIMTVYQSKRSKYC